MERVSLIVNSESGSQDIDEILPLVYDAFGPNLPVTRFISPGQPADVLAAEEVADGSALVIAAGGDGTVSQVAGALRDTGARLGVLPLGTANAFARAMGIPLDPAEAIHALLHGLPRTIDLGCCNQRPLVLLAAIGYEAEIVRHATRERKEWLGAFAYLYTGLELLARQQPFSVKITTHHRTLETKASAVTVANVAPATSPLAQGMGSVIPDDGLLEVTVFAPHTPSDAFARMWELFGAAAFEVRIWRDDIVAFRTRDVRLETDPAQLIAIDGEVIGDGAAECGVWPGALRVQVPKPAR